MWQIEDIDLKLEYLFEISNDLYNTVAGHFWI